LNIVLKDDHELIKDKAIKLSDEKKIDEHYKKFNTDYSNLAPESQPSAPYLTEEVERTKINKEMAHSLCNWVTFKFKIRLKANESMDTKILLSLSILQNFSEIVASKIFMNKVIKQDGAIKLLEQHGITSNLDELNLQKTNADYEVTLPKTVFEKIKNIHEEYEKATKSLLKKLSGPKIKKSSKNVLPPPQIVLEKPNDSSFFKKPQNKRSSHINDFPDLENMSYHEINIPTYNIDDVLKNNIPQSNFYSKNDTSSEEKPNQTKKKKKREKSTLELVLTAVASGITGI